jgi:hypothetical protein
MKRWSVVALLVAAFASPASYAQLKNCTNLGANGTDYKIVVDDFAFVSANPEQNAALTALRDRLQFNVNVQLDMLKSAARESGNLTVLMRPVTCVGRRPSLDGSEFTAALAERLSDAKVVVEMWGTLDMQAGTRAMIGYAIPPVQHYFTQSEAPPIHLLSYPKTGIGAAEALENLPELPAFALVGLGTKAARNGSYDLAVWAFTRAEAAITQAQPTVANPNLEALLAYVQRAACVTRASAKSDPGYRGALKLVPAQSCGATP